MLPDTPTIFPIPGFAEPFSSISHLIFGTTIFAFLTPFLLYHGRGSQLRLFWLSVFSVSTLTLLSLSGVYHLLTPGGFAREEVLRRLDHAAIFVLIAGTFTGAHGILFRGPWRWAFISLLWIGAATAIALKTIFFHSIGEVTGLALYLGFGWLGLASGIKLYRQFGFQFILPVLLGGIAYTLGAVGEFLHEPVLIPGVVGPHEFFHVMVLIGLAFHWWFLWEVAAGARRSEVKLEADEIDRLVKEGVGLSELLGFEVQSVTKDTAVVRLPHKQQHLRAGGTISGPVMMTLADVTMYALIMAALGPEMLAVTTSMTLNFLSKPPAADLIGRGRILKLGKRLVVMEVLIHSTANDEPVAQVTGTYSLPPAKAVPVAGA